ncbi:MAG: OpgC domain-containing protein [Pseudomonadota bacterium]
MDFFRGIAMFIILLAHTPGNPWTRWIPARFGFSDATEIFVFCSGMASALAFGAIFERRGWLMGTVRTAHRVWQVYWAHIGMFVVIAMSMLWLNTLGLERDYLGQLNLIPFFRNPEGNLLGLMTLTYVPNYFDILPMYLVILCMIPIVMGLGRIDVRLAFVFVALLWAAASVGRFADEGWTGLAPLAAHLEFLHLPAQYWFEPPNNTRSWFFNPFTWQLVFFTGFMLMKGWIPAPPVRRWLIVMAALILLVSFPFSHIGIRYEEFMWGQIKPEDARGVIQLRVAGREWLTKTDFGILRYIHFLALAYLAWVAVGPLGSRLNAGVWWPRVVTVIRKVGQQSLAVFLTSMVLARFMGVAFDLGGKGILYVTFVNLCGFAILIGTAYFVGWIKGNPWKGDPAAKPEKPSAGFAAAPREQTA